MNTFESRISNMRFLLLLAMLFSHRSFAQDFFGFLSPDAPLTSIELEGFYLPNSDVDGGIDNSQVVNTAIGINQRVYRDEKHFVAVGAKYQKLDLTAENPFLRDYYNQQLSFSFKRNFEENKFWLGSLSYGSASDRPWENNRDNTLSANYIQKVNERWFIAANYSNNRPFLNNIPLPGFIYVKEMTQERQFIVGFPFILWQVPMSDHFSFRYFGLLPFAHRMKILYTKNRRIMPYVGFEQSPQTFFRHDREERYDRFFWFERRLQIGLEGKISKSMRFDLSGGLAFDRQFFEARNFTQDKKNEVDLEKAGFAALSIRYNFY